MGSVKKTIYFNDLDVISKLQEQSNMSRYISELIKSDINRTSNMLTRDEVINLIKTYIGANKNTAPTSPINDIESSINSVLDMLD